MGDERTVRKLQRSCMDDLGAAGEALTDEHLWLAAGAIMRRTSGACKAPSSRDGRMVDTIVEFHAD
jgi:hypothetical protein